MFVTRPHYMHIEFCECRLVNKFGYSAVFELTVCRNVCLHCESGENDVKKLNMLHWKKLSHCGICYSMLYPLLYIDF